jgi:nucleotide-binding universal stress UspA family protein
MKIKSLKGAGAGADSEPPEFRENASFDERLLTRAPALFKRILVAIDFSDSSVRAVEYAAKLAVECRASMILLHVVEASKSSHDFGKDESYENLLEPERDRLNEFQKKRVQYRGSMEILVRMGRAGSEIPDTAKALGADLIVMGVNGQSGFKSVMLGSTAERVLAHAHCPVLTVRPLLK